MSPLTRRTGIRARLRAVLASHVRRDAGERARECAELADRVMRRVREGLPGCSDGLLRPDPASDDDLRFLGVIAREFARGPQARDAWLLKRTLVICMWIALTLFGMLVCLFVFGAASASVQWSLMPKAVEVFVVSLCMLCASIPTMFVARQLALRVAAWLFG